MISSNGVSQNTVKTFESENGFYKLEYPADFNITYEDNVLNIFPTDNKSAFTISSYYFENGIDDSRFTKMFEIFTKNYNPSGEKIKLNNYILIQRFDKQADNETVIWTMCLNRNNKILLVISINFGENEQDEIIDHYQEILQSIVNIGAN